MRLFLLPAALALASACPTAAAQSRAARAPAVPAACVDFHGHVNAIWHREHPADAARPERSRLGDMAALAMQAHETLLAEAQTAPQDANEALLGRFWAAGIDEAQLDVRGPAALDAALAPLATLRGPRDIPKVAAALHEAGLAPLVEFMRLDAADGGGRPLAAFPTALGLGDPAFYTLPDAEIRTLLGQYRAYVETLLRASGLPEAEISPASEAVLQIETQLAQAMQAEAADARQGDALRAQDRRYAALGLAAIIKRLGVDDATLVMVRPGYFATLSRIAAERDTRRLKWFLRFRIAHRLAPELHRPMRSAHADFHAKLLRGEAAAPSRREHMEALLRRHLGGLVDAVYTVRHAPAPRRERAEAVAKAVRDAAATLVARHDADAAKALSEALIEVATAPTFKAAGLELRADDHVGNLLRIQRWREARLLAGETVAVAALPARRPAVQWQPSRRALAVSAAALAPPLLEAGEGAPSPTDFGALGALAGHELAKAVPAGNRAAGLGPLFNGLQAAPGLRVDGVRTLAANRADLAGLEFAWAAFETRFPGADAPARQAFFRGWATVWAKTQTPEALRTEVQSSPYAPNAFRVNATLAQLPAFAQAFGCRAGQPMRAAQPIGVWR